MLDVPGWTGHRAGQHVDVRLTAEDGYQARAELLDRVGAADEPLALTVERLDDGEVSPYLVDELRPGDRFELRGPDRRLLRLGRRAAAGRCSSSPAARASCR